AFLRFPVSNLRGMKRLFDRAKNIAPRLCCTLSECRRTGLRGRQRSTADSSQSDAGAASTTIDTDEVADARGAAEVTGWHDRSVRATGSIPLHRLVFNWS